MARRDLFQKAWDYTDTRRARTDGWYPFFPEFEGYDGCVPGEIRYKGRNVLMFGSNNYLGLTWDPRVREAAVQAIKRYGTGCSGSRILNGTLDLHVKLEADLADFVGKEAALVFSTGFQVNTGVLSALGGRNDVIVCDRRNHASIVDGIMCSPAKLARYRHNDMTDLDAVLRAVPPEESVLIAVDSVFSMEGDMADLKGIVSLAREHGVRLYVDEAHGVGVLGANGSGASEFLGVRDDVDLIMGTFSKAFASAGGFVAGPADVIEYLRHFSRTLIFSASIPPASLATVQKCLDIIRAEPECRTRVLRISRRLRDQARALGLPVPNGVTPIIPVRVGQDARKLCAVYHELLDMGVYVNPVVPPAAAECLLRVSCTAVHEDRHVDRLLEALTAVAAKYGLPAEWMDALPSCGGARMVMRPNRDSE